ncbi:MAG TPA: hypothetical protein VFT22_06890 [Kofleriaceae bacterium]|nr:hypothetical protein [Kofleriaceae bacterium]
MPDNRFYLALAPCCLLVACASAASDGDEAFTEAESVSAPEQTLQAVRAMGQVQVAQVQAAALSSPARTPISPQLRRALQDRLEELTQRPQAGTGSTGLAPPTASSLARAGSDGGAFTFTGMGISDVDRALGGATGITPPDQGLCVGNGFVLEAVNSALQIYDILGSPVGPSVDFVPFFNFPPDTAASFSFASDPKCNFDPATGRFFATVLRIPVDATTGAISGSFLDIAVSQTDDPRGAWNLYEADLTDTGANGTPNHAHCPCLGDQPLIGADSNGFYVTTNEFGLDPESPGFNGAQIYAFDKQALVAGSLGSVVHLANLVLADGIAFSVQPATSPTGTGADDANGSEYFLSSLDFQNANDNRIALWSLSNTATLGSTAVNLELEHAVLRSETYGPPPAASQKVGPTPLRDCLAAGTCPADSGLGGVVAINNVEQLETDDDRMNQTVFAGGLLWAGLNTVVVQKSGKQRAGIAFFAVEPRRLGNGRLGGRVRKQGYITLDNTDAMYPSIALTDDGRGAIAFSISGDNDFPSTAYVRLINSNLGPLHVATAGAGPLDDLSGYAATPDRQGPSRFGDYSAALIDGSTLWMASEAVTSACLTLDCPFRDVFTNWGTSVTRLDLDDDVDR